MDWTPRSQRLGKTNYDGPFEGVPAHLSRQLATWLRQTLDSSPYPDDAAADLALRLHIVVSRGPSAVPQLVIQAAQDADVFLDCVEGALHVDQVFGSIADRASLLQKLLTLSGSAYRVSDDGQSIVYAVSTEVEEIKTKALSVNDEAAQELAEAWVKAYGRSPDESDAWDHAIKAVEAVLRPAVEPKNRKATLGTMTGVLNDNPAAWRCVFPGKSDDHAVENFIATLRLIWPNPDRHGGGGRKPSLDEARAVVTLSATIVQWAREGTVVSKR